MAVVTDSYVDVQAPTVEQLAFETYQQAGRMAREAKLSDQYVRDVMVIALVTLLALLCAPIALHFHGSWGALSMVTIGIPAIAASAALYGPILLLADHFGLGDSRIEKRFKVRVDAVAEAAWRSMLAHADLPVDLREAGGSLILSDDLREASVLVRSAVFWLFPDGEGRPTWRSEAELLNRVGAIKHRSPEQLLARTRRMIVDDWAVAH